VQSETEKNMPLSERKRLSHVIPFWVHDDDVFFITVCCAAREANQLCRPEIAILLFESIAFRNNRDLWHARLCVLMPDHLHLLVSFPKDASMKHLISAWKEHLAKQCGIKWQRDFFDHRLRGAESYRDKASYIRENPVRKGLCSTAEEWPFTWSDETIPQ
jgi:REP element-mobilizing transposase RayT